MPRVRVDALPLLDLRHWNKAWGQNIAQIGAPERNLAVQDAQADAPMAKMDATQEHLLIIASQKK